MTQQAYEQTVKQQEHIEDLLTIDSYDKWLYQNYTITNGDMLLSYYEDGNTQAKYLREMGLDENLEIRGL